MIDDNKKLTDTQKLFYLRASLKGEAKQIETSDDTFSSLLNALQERYENKWLLIVDTHIKSIINHENLIQESEKYLRSLLGCIRKNLRALKVFNFDGDILSNVLLLNIVLQKLDREARRQYELR